MILFYVEYLKVSTKNHGTNKWLHQDAEYKINVQKSIVFPFNSNEQVQFEIRNAKPFILAPQKWNI